VTNQNRGQTGTNGGGHQSSGNGVGSTVTLEQILDELRRETVEQRKYKDEIKKVGQMVAKLEEYRKLNHQLKQQADAVFTVETSGYKVEYSNNWRRGSHSRLIQFP
jgi:hypothetical protein